MVGNFLQKMQLARQEFEQGKAIRKILLSDNPGIIKSPAKIITELKELQKARTTLAYKNAPPAIQRAYTQQLLRDILTRR